MASVERKLVSCLESFENVIEVPENTAAEEDVGGAETQWMREASNLSISLSLSILAPSLESSSSSSSACGLVCLLAV